MNRVSKKQRKALSDVMPLEISLADFVRQELHEFVIAQGMIAVQKLLEEDRDRLCGAAYERCEQPDELAALLASWSLAAERSESNVLGFAMRKEKWH